VLLTIILWWMVTLTVHSASALGITKISNSLEQSGLSEEELMSWQLEEIVKVPKEGSTI
jgi:uncharacterized FlgJ-related protein